MTDFLTGAIGTAAAGLFTNPLEVAKVQFQLQGERGGARKYTSVFQTFTVLAKSEGLAGVQRGLAPALWYQVFMNGMRLGSYTSMSARLKERFRDDPLSPVPQYLCGMAMGALSGSLGALAGNPFYLIKIRAQAAARDSAIAVGDQHAYHGLVPALRTILREEGGRGLFRGVDACVARVATGGAVQLATYSSTKEVLQRRAGLSDGGALQLLRGDDLGPRGGHGNESDGRRRDARDEPGRRS